MLDLDDAFGCNLTVTDYESDDEGDTAEIAAYWAGIPASKNRQILTHLFVTISVANTIALHANHPSRVPIRTLLVKLRKYSTL